MAKLEQNELDCRDTAPLIGDAFQIKLVVLSDLLVFKEGEKPEYLEKNLSKQCIPANSHALGVSLTPAG